MSKKKDKERIKEYYKAKAESKGKKLEEMNDGKFVEVHQEHESILYEQDLFKMITEKEFEKKITGEIKSRKSIFLSLCSIWVDDMEIPLNTLVSSESSAGKSYVCKKVIEIFPKEMFEYRSKITAEAFTYWHTNEEDWTWDGKICYLEDINQTVLDSPTFKVMCSEGSTATVVRNQKAINLWVNGKPSILITTARTNPSTEILNRFNIVSLDESAKQTHDITLNQALENKNESYNPNIKKALSQLHRLGVTIPFAPAIHNFISQKYGWNDVRLRRDFSRLIALIKCSTVLHQLQRQRELLASEGASYQRGKVIAEEQDYEIARECINYIKTSTLKGLTHKLKKAYDACLVLKEFTAKEIHSKSPIVSQKMWYKYLDDLLERNLLTTESRDIEGERKDGKRYVTKTTFYKIKEKTSFNLPSMKELSKYTIINTIDTMGKNATIGTNVTIADSDCNECSDLLGKEPLEVIKIGDKNDKKVTL